MDIGDVLIRTEPAHHRALAELVGWGAAEVAAALDAAGVAAAFDVGGLAEDGFVAAVGRALGRPELSREEIEPAWDRVIGATDPVVAGVAARFAAAGRLVLASNTDPFHWRLIRSRLAAAGIECPAYLSFEVGVKKPAAAFYAALAAGEPPVPPGSVYVDDKADNVAAATASGLDGWLHRDPAETAARLAALLP